MIAERKSNFELLRMLAIAGVVVLHFNLVGALYAPGMNINKVVVLFLEALFVCSTNLFIMLTGYFMVNRSSISLWKPLSLVIQMAVIELLVYIVQIFAGAAEFGYRALFLAVMPNNYFLVLYVALYIISPYINHLLNSLSEKSARNLVLILLLMFSVWNYGIDIFGRAAKISMVSSSTVSYLGSINGYTIVNFVLCYMVGAALRKGILRFDRPLILFVVCVLAIFAVILVDIDLAICYHSPFAIGCAAAAILMAEKVNIKSRIINKLAKAAFTVYIINIPVLEMLDIERYCQGGLAAMLAYLLFCVVLVYGIGCIVHYSYDFVSDIVFKKLRDKTEKLVISV